MKIAIEIPGLIDNGLWSGGRGEGRWVQNIATALAADPENEIICFGVVHLTWGAQPPLPNVRLYSTSHYSSPEFQNQSVDIFIDTQWWKGKSATIKAKSYWHLHFGFEEHILDPGFIGPDHYIVYPLEHLDKVFLDKKRNPYTEKTFFVPWASFEDKPKQPNENGNGLLWAGKDAFLDRFFGPADFILESASDTLDIYVTLANKYPDMPMHFMMGQQLNPNWHECRRALKHYDVSRRLDQIKNKILYPQLNYQECLSLINKTKVSFSHINWASHLDCLSQGTMAVIRSGYGVFDQVAEDANVLFPPWQGDKEELIAHIERLMIDTEYYKNTVLKIQSALTNYSFESIRIITNKFYQEKVTHGSSTVKTTG